MNTVAKVVELTASSTRSFDDAMQNGIARAMQTLDNVTGAWVQEMKLDIRDGKISAYRVNMKVTFVLEDGVKPAARATKKAARKTRR